MGKPHAPRLYSIASSRYGDEFDGKTTSMGVRRATYWCPELKADDPAKKGICPNFLCDAKPGDKVMMTGPVGKALLLDESNPNNVHTWWPRAPASRPTAASGAACSARTPPSSSRAWAVLHGRGQLGRQALRRRAPGDPEELPRPVPRGLRALPRAAEQGRRQDVHPGQGGGVRGGGLPAAAGGRHHLLLRAQGHDARHQRHARARGHLQGHRVGHLPEGPQEERAVPRGGVLRRPPWREACDSRRARRHLSIRTDTHS